MVVNTVYSERESVIEAIAKLLGGLDEPRRRR